MGGDRAPSINVDGAIQACREWSDVEVILVGDQFRLSQELKKFHPGSNLKITIHHSPTMVDMHESPVEACRSKPDASIMVCAKMVAEGKVDGLVSAGNSGATMAASLFHLRRLEGIS